MTMSILIPARNEEWLGHTVRDVLAHTSEATEIIVVLDGAWPTEPLPQDARVQVVYVPTPIGQRAATNLGARISTARYICKLDAHCSVAPGFDTALIEAAAELGDDVTQIPAQKNLHVFDWVCAACHWRQYQGVQLATCPQCHRPDALRREVIWKPRRGTTTTSWIFDQTLHFAYDRKRQARQQGDICDVMTSLGACVFMRRDRFWQLGGLDEKTGSWGQYGQELACKSWLSGGRHVVNKATWFSHLFRVGGLGFPYPISGSDQARARDYARAVWFSNSWPGQTLPLSWLVEKFWPIDGWSADSRDQVLSAGRDFTSSIAVSKKQGRIPIWTELGPSRLLPSIQGFSTEPRPVLSGSATLARDAEEFAVPPNDIGVSSAASIETSAPHVLDMRHDFQVGRVGAVPSSAGMVNFNAVTYRDRPDQPLIGEPVQAHNSSVPTDAGVAGMIHAAGPIPTAGSVVDCDLAEDAGERSTVEVGNGEILGSSHASASCADVGSGPSARHQRVVGPSSNYPTTGLVYYTDGRIDDGIGAAVCARIAAAGLPTVAVTCENRTIPVDWLPNARRIALPTPRGPLAMFRQILAGLEALDTEFACLVEHDLLYAPDHFAFRPPTSDRYYYNVSTWKLDVATGRAVFYRCKQTSGLCASRELLIRHYRERVRRVEAEGFSRRMGFEPGSHGRQERVDDVRAEEWRSAVPNIDLRHGQNLTPSRWSPAEFRDRRNCQEWTEAREVPGWGPTADILAALRPLVGVA